MSSEKFKHMLMVLETYKKSEITHTICTHPLHTFKVCYHPETNGYQIVNEDTNQAKLYDNVDSAAIALEEAILSK
ncbi:hypothetical protein [Sutcliffiella deserti]|uniref:hypothetical protein n=1 Tax=Sutcliffiella deserti TaxID=2875501 RepID=UPI001CBDBBA2|nr:hypothetical protein [Sutcliffiella deserti]